MLGTRRIGPDLARASGTRTDQWHLAHLYAPRTVVPLSVMPGYPELFEGSADRPGREALDLLAYIESLGRERELAWPEGDERARALTDDERALMSLTAEVLNAHPGRTRPLGLAPALPSGELQGSDNSGLGMQLFRDNCSGCHGDSGEGDGPASSLLSPPPVALQNTAIAVICLQKFFGMGYMAPLCRPGETFHWKSWRHWRMW